MYLQTLAYNYRRWSLLEKYKYFRYLVLKKTPVRYDLGLTVGYWRVAKEWDVGKYYS